MDKTVVVTGASRGIGRAAARLFAQKGCRVAINYLRSEEEALSLERELTGAGLRAAAIRADVSVRGEAEGLFAKTRALFGPVDVLVNNAGISEQKLFTDITDGDWKRMMDVHVGGTFLCCQAALSEMIARKSGRIINLSSIWGVTGASCEVHYSAAKAAVIGLTKALAKELGPSGIQVNCVAPGAIETDMNAELDEKARAMLAEETPLGRFGRPEEIASLLYFLAGEGGDFLTGQVISPNGGLVI